MEKPKISVVTVCYNAETEIEATMRSVLNQTYENVEYILVDGASHDGTLHVIRKVWEGYKGYKNKEIIIKSEPDKGIYDAMNKGIDLATGEWINFMNVGDRFADNNVVEDFFQKADTKEPNDLLYGDVILEYSFGRYHKDVSHKLMSNSMPCHQTIFARTSLMKKRHFNLKYKISADLDFFVQALKSGSHYEYVPVTVACYKQYEGLSTSPWNWRKLELERYQIFNKPKDFHYHLLRLQYTLQKHFHIRNTWLNIDEKERKSVEADPYTRRID